MPLSAEIDAQVTPVQTASGCIKYTKPKAQCMFLKIFKELQDVGPHQVEFSLLL